MNYKKQTTKQTTKKGISNMNKDKNETIEITVKSAWALLIRIEEWLQWTDRLDAQTRLDIAAMDELVKLLDAEDYLDKQWYARQAEHEKHMAAYKAKQEEEAGEN
jgi:hypothetical protein